MPMPIHLAHRLAERLAAVRKDGTLDYLGPDGKTQVSVRYREGRPVGVDKLLISTQHDEGIDSQSQIKPELWENVILPVLNAEVPGSQLRRTWPPAPGSLAAVERSLDRGQISARGVVKVVRVAWTLADLAGRPRPTRDDCDAALGLWLGVRR